jgi:MerR family transcriptional regulator, heat shock protein HspR
MEFHSYDKPVFRISVVSELLNAHPQSLRRYETLGLVTPHRLSSNSRLYSQKDMDDIREIRRLTQRPNRVGIEGVRMILKLRHEALEMKRRIAELEAKYGETPTVDMDAPTEDNTNP